MSIIGGSWARCYDFWWIWTKAQYKRLFERQETVVISRPHKFLFHGWFFYCDVRSESLWGACFVQCGTKRWFWAGKKMFKILFISSLFWFGVNRLIFGGYCWSVLLHRLMGFVWKHSLFIASRVFFNYNFMSHFVTLSVLD